MKGRVVLITGGARGLGREMALELAARGANVAITAAATSEALNRTVAETGAHAIIADVTKDAESTVAQVRDRFGRIDVLINNAGRGMRLVSESFNTTPTKFWETDPEAWRRIMDINLNGAFLMTRAVVPAMIAQGSGKIINISTSDITMVRRGYAPYGPSKAALEAASRIWAQDLEGTGVDVNVYLPGGAADTDLLPPAGVRRGADGNLLPALVMRRAIGWLASDASNGVTGARFIANLWDSALPDDQAAAGARSPHAVRPQIM